MDPTAVGYHALQRTLRALTPLVGRGTSKLARGLAGRRGAADRLVTWGVEHRDRSRPCAWFHAPSVGEGLQARAVLEALRVACPDLQALYTHFSPSAVDLAAKMPADAAGYLPWDLPGEMAAVLDACVPDIVVFTKTEVWPTLVAEASARDVPCVLVGGTVPPGARRSRWPARTLLRSTWARLERVGVIGEADGEGFRALGVRGPAVEVTGDPGIDSAAQRARGADPEAPYLRPFTLDRRPTLVAGSTWPADDAVLLPALLAARERVPGLRGILAPHEPGAEHVASLLDRLGRDGWSAAALADVEGRGSAEEVDMVVVDRVGVLAHLYTVGDAAYVGGGFHDAGLHSVLEPAAARLPVCFGPRHRNARAAGELLAEEGAQMVRDVGTLAEVVSVWLSKNEVHDYAARRAFGYIERHLGAAGRSAAFLRTLIA